MKCPACNETLIIMDRQSIEINYCRKCKGVWLGRAELDKIIEKNSATAAPGSNFNAVGTDLHNNNPFYKHKKRRGFLNDLFDFD